MESIIELESLELELDPTRTMNSAEDSDATRCWGPCPPPPIDHQEELEVLEV
jgi:hypothetical protein